MKERRELIRGAFLRLMINATWISPGSHSGQASLHAREQRP